MAVDFTIKQNDNLPELEVQLTDADGNHPNLSGATVLFVMTNKSDGTEQVSAAATLVDAPVGIVKYSWAADGSDTAVIGSFNGEFEVQYGNGDIETFPNWKNLQIKVFDDLGGVR